jgi:hypothetical protein
MEQLSTYGLATLDVKIILSPEAQRRRREARFRNALFSLRLIDRELSRMETLLSDELVSNQQNHFARMFFEVCNDLNRMRFYLDCGSFDKKLTLSPKQLSALDKWLGESNATYSPILVGQNISNTGDD